MAPSEPTPSRSRGRPVEIDRDHLARVALQLFGERGYEKVSAAEIATAAGISRRSLFRYFPTKADLVWDRFEDSIVVLADALANESGEPIAAASRALETMAEQTRIMELSRIRLQTIAAHPDLFAYGTSRLQAQAAVLHDYFVEREFSDLEAKVTSSALTMAVFHGFVHWAVSESEEPPANLIREAISALKHF